MEILLVIAAMVLVGLLVGFLGGVIWKDNQPFGPRGDYLAAIITAVIVGLLDWLVIPAMGFSNTIRLIGILFEPPLAALFVLWVLRKARG